MMEVRASSEQGVMAGREPFELPKNPPLTPPPSSGPMQSVRMAYTPDGTPFFAPVSSAPPAPETYQPGGSAAPGPDAAAAAGGNGAPVLPVSVGEPVSKKKRGRPRKYGNDGSMSLALVPESGPFSPDAMNAAGTVPLISPDGRPDGMKKRGRPKGSTNKVKKHMSALNIIGSAGAGFTPHVMFVQAGEDVCAKIMAFSQHGTRGVCILSANGAISNVTLRQAATSGGTVTYEGRFEILSLSGSFLLSENGGHRSRTGGLSVSLASPDGRVMGGGVAGVLIAAAPVQIVVGSFNTIVKKEPKHQPPSGPASAPAPVPVPTPTPAPTPAPVPAPAMIAPISGVMGPSSPPSRGTLSESSGGGPGSPMNQGAAASNHSQPGLSSMPWK